MPNPERGFVDLHPGLLVEQLSVLLAGDLRWSYAARLEGAELCTWAAGLPQQWPQGRAFGPEREVRWEWLPNGLYRVSILTEDPARRGTGSGWVQAVADIDGCRERRILLWGELGYRDPSALAEWIEMRIPQALHYPIDKVDHSVPRVVIRGFDYLVHHMPVTTRWAFLEQAQSSLPMLAQEE